MFTQHPPTPESSPQPSSAARPPERASHGGPSVGPSLDEKGTALLHLLPEALAAYQPQVTAMLDDVVVTLEPQNLLEACHLLKTDPGLKFDHLRLLTVVDFRERFEIVYHLWSTKRRHKLVVKTSVPIENPVVPSIVPAWRAADWFEREGHELFGVTFQGHPNLKPLLLWEGFEGYPGRKDYPFYEYQEW
ncbi:MAG: NADH-quinone oxidoreductase subunit C [Chloroflexi bacterium]|nr:NADH-quinone oxidoreductase subunit C [Chloroflexota bacterium]